MQKISLKTCFKLDFVGFIIALFASCSKIYCKLAGKLFEIRDELIFCDLAELDYISSVASYIYEIF